MQRALARILAVLALALACLLACGTLASARAMPSGGPLEDLTGGSRRLLTWEWVPGWRAWRWRPWWA